MHSLILFNVLKLIFAQRELKYYNPTNETKVNEEL